MKIKDIVNREIVNLTNCDQEPIHIPGSIQPHGFLLGINDNSEIEYCSGNVNEFTGIAHAQLLNKPLSALLDPDELTKVNDHDLGLKGDPVAPIVLNIGKGRFNCSIHRSRHITVLECEAADAREPGLLNVYDQAIQFVRYMQEATTLRELCDKVAQEVRVLTGYDRVMVYRFDKHYNGEVYAEQKREDLESFLDLHYPHTDIPVQARQLYIRNLLRLIVDVNYEPVPIFTADDGNPKHLDLSLSVLRSTSPIHVQYLHNMGVGATLTISLLHGGKLWGLIACHHYSPKYLDHYTRMNAQLQGHFLTSQITVRQAAEEYAIAKEVNASLEGLLNMEFPPSRESLSGIVKEPALLALCNAGGVAIVLDGLIYRNGLTPSDEQILKLAEWAGPFSKYRFFSSSKLEGKYERAAEICSSSSGIIFFNMRSARQACIIWFNPETLEEVKWAGDPEKAIEKNENGLSPRKSFEAWKVITKCQAREWREPELTAAANFAYAMQKHITHILLNEEEIQQRLLTDKLKESNAELENINWISTHDLREPLRKIQVFSSKLLMVENELPAGNVAIVEKIDKAAKRMQKLIDSLSIYAKTRQTNEIFTEVDLQKIVRNILEELKDDLEETHASIHVLNMPKVKGIPVLLQQLFVNLVNNALKFSKPGTTPHIVISGDESPIAHPSGIPGTYWHLSVTDRGIGFDPHMKEVIFKVFSRLNPGNHHDGSGIGLAVCRKVMQIHGGHIEAHGALDQGAIFDLYFPLSTS